MSLVTGISQERCYDSLWIGHFPLLQADCDPSVGFYGLPTIEWVHGDIRGWISMRVRPSLIRQFSGPLGFVG